MDTNTTVSSPTTITFNFDAQAHWGWAHEARALLRNPDDRHSFDTIAHGATILNPNKVWSWMMFILADSPGEIMQPGAWKAAAELARKQAQASTTQSFQLFAEDIASHLAQLIPAGTAALLIDVYNPHTGRSSTASQFGLDDPAVWDVLGHDLEHLTYTHAGSSFATLEAKAAGRVATVELHFPSNVLRMELAEHHFETVIEGPDAVIKHLNDAPDDHVALIDATISENPELDIWRAEARL